VPEQIEPTEPTSQLAPPAAPDPAPRKKHLARTIVISAAGALVGVVAANLIIGGIRGAASYDGLPIITETTKSPGALPDIQVSTDKLQAKIEAYVKATKAAVVLPKRLDEVTTWTDVKAETGDIHYFYAIDASVDPSNLSVDILKPAVATQVCGIPSAKAVLKDDIDFHYTYAFDGSTTTYEFTMTGDDCD
jgi:hypothetical protein